MDVDIPFVPWTVVHTEEDDDHDDCPNVGGHADKSVAAENSLRFKKFRA